MDDLRIICMLKKIKRKHFIITNLNVKLLLINKVIKTHIQASIYITEPFGLFLTGLPFALS